MDTPHDFFRQVVAETGDHIAGIRAIRERFGLSLCEAKEVWLQVENIAASLAEHHDRIAEWLGKDPLDTDEQGEPRAALDRRS